jgi:ribonuclease P protein component
VSRLRSAAEFQSTMRLGCKVACPPVVVHARLNDQAVCRAGFIVSKAVGNAVVRNRVKRQLRHLIAGEFAVAPAKVDVVVRALPKAASQNLREPVRTAFATALGKLGAAA